MDPIHVLLTAFSAFATVVAIVTGLAVGRLCELVRLLRKQQDDDRNHFEDECRGLAARLTRIDGERTYYRGIAERG